MKRIPTVIIPRTQMMMVIQMMGPVQSLTKTKKRSERKMAAKAAAIRTSQP